MKKRIGNKFIRETCVAGAAIDVTLKYSTASGQDHRQQKRNPSRAAVIKNNDRIATKKLTRLMNANFFPGDLHCIFTYAGKEPEQKEAKREIRNFKRRIEREYKKRGRDCKWIEVTEYSHTRIHHHMLMSYIEPEVIEKQWKRGHVHFTPLDRSRNYSKLAEYFIKETSKTMRQPGNETKQRWSASRNLARPIIKREIIEAKAMFEKPKALKGYEILQESVREFEHPFTGLLHKEYMMLSTDPSPRLKKWRKGAVVEKDETFRRAQEIQIEMDWLDGWGTL